MQIRSTPQVEKKNTHTQKKNVAWLGQAQRSLVFNITEHRNAVTVLFMWQLINIMQLDITTRWYSLYVCGRQAASIIAYKLYILLFYTFRTLFEELGGIFWVNSHYHLYYCNHAAKIQCFYASTMLEHTDMLYQRYQTPTEKIIRGFPSITIPRIVMSVIELVFLGTGSAYPSPHRGASCMVLRSSG